MRVQAAVVQLTPTKAKVQQNLDRIAEAVRQASAEDVDLVCFSEASTTGYFLEGGVLEGALTSQELFDEVARRLGGLARPIDVVLGFYERSEGNLYNACAYLELGPSPRLVHTYRKFFLPTYGVFDEERFVSRGTNLGVFETRFGKVGILICEDVWHSVMPTLAAVAGAQILVVPSASPGRGFEGETVQNLDRYVRLIRALCEEHGVFCVNPQLTGFEGGKGFIGGSVVVDPFARVLAQAAVGEEAMILATLDLSLIEWARSQLPLLSDLQSAWGDVLKLAQELPS